jgi:hypothetical protein
MKQARLSKHAMCRRAQSNLRESDIEIVRRYGVLEHRTGARFYVVLKREVERFCDAEPRLRKLHDIVMVVSSDDKTVITVYRNSRALREIRRKSKVHRPHWD